MMQRTLATLMLFLVALDTSRGLLAQSEAAAAKPLLETSVGMRGRIDELPLPGSQLRAKEVADPQKAEVLVRVLNVFRHGSGFRYNIEVMPFVAGTIDLRDHLEREDGSSTDDLPEMQVEVAAFLPDGQIMPNELQNERPAAVGGYRTTAILVGIAWVLGLLAILFVGRGKSAAAIEAQQQRPKTFADRLRPLIERAADGSLDDSGRAEVERLLLAHWRRRLGLQDEKIGEAVARLRDDEEAGALLRQLEIWLHRPTLVGSNDSIDIQKLLEPYAAIADAEATSAGARA